MKFAYSASLVVFLLALLAYPSASLKNSNQGKQFQSHKRHASPEDIEIAQKTWPQIIMENAETSGVVILKTFPDKFNYYSMFKATWPPIMENAEANTAVMNAGNTKKIEPLLKALGKAHERRGVTKQHVDNLFGVIEDTVKTA